MPTEEERLNALQAGISQLRERRGAAILEFNQVVQTTGFQDAETYTNEVYALLKATAKVSQVLASRFRPITRWFYESDIQRLPGVGYRVQQLRRWLDRFVAMPYSGEDIFLRYLGRTAGGYHAIGGLARALRAFRVAGRVLGPAAWAAEVLLIPFTGGFRGVPRHYIILPYEFDDHANARQGTMVVRRLDFSGNAAGEGRILFNVSALYPTWQIRRMRIGFTEGTSPVINAVLNPLSWIEAFNAIPGGSQIIGQRIESLYRREVGNYIVLDGWVTFEPHYPSSLDTVALVRDIQGQHHALCGVTEYIPIDIDPNNPQQNNTVMQAVWDRIGKDAGDDD